MSVHKKVVALKGYELTLEIDDTGGLEYLNVWVSKIHGVGPNDEPRWVVFDHLLERKDNENQ